MESDDDLLHRAASCAVTAHRGANRKSSPLPYVSHCFDVLKQLSVWGVRDQELLAGALLHDTVEDTAITEQVLREGFGDNVTELVLAVTWPDQMGKAAKFNHLAQLREHAASPRQLAQILLLKMADRICNVTDFHGERNNDLYASTYALLGFPVFRLWLEGGATGWVDAVSGAPLKLSPSLGRSLDRYEEIVREKFDDFRVEGATIEGVRQMLFRG